jgi:putative inorganic carbon (hco3(-)) transporter
VEQVRPMEEKPKDAIAFWALVAFVAVTYAVPAEWIPGASVLRPALTTSALAAGAMVMGFLGRREPIRLDGIRGFSLLGLALLTYASVLWSVYGAATTPIALELVKLVAIYFTVVNVVTTERRLAQLAIAAVLASVIASVGVIQWHQAGVDLVEGYRARWVGVFADPNIMAKNLGLIVPLALALFVRKQSHWVLRLGCAVATVLAVTAIILSHSRGGFIGLSLAVFVWVMREKNLLRTSLVGLAAAAVLVFAPASFWNRTDSVTAFRTDASAQGRINAWKVTSEISKDRPLLGVGAGAFRYAWPLYAPPEAHRAYMAHNVFLQVLAEQRHCRLRALHDVRGLHDGRSLRSRQGRPHRLAGAGDRGLRRRLPGLRPVRRGTGVHTRLPGVRDGILRGPPGGAPESEHRAPGGSADRASAAVRAAGSAVLASDAKRNGRPPLGGGPALL